MQITFLNSQVKKFNFERIETDEEDHLDFSVGPGFSEEESTSFVVMFEVNVVSQHGYKFELIYEAEFETDKVITKEFQDSHFPSINSPAIAYPYMRSFVGTMTLNAGFEPLVLPVVNFQALAAENAKRESSE